MEQAAWDQGEEYLVLDRPLREVVTFLSKDNAAHIFTGWPVASVTYIPGKWAEVRQFKEYIEVQFGNVIATMITAKLPGGDISAVGMFDHASGVFVRGKYTKIGFGVVYRSGQQHHWGVDQSAEGGGGSAAERAQGGHPVPPAAARRPSGRHPEYAHGERHQGNLSKI
jgi:hypothetical protein